MDAESEVAAKPVCIKPYQIFLIGFSGGGIAAIFPRLITYIASTDQNTIVLSFDFMLVAALFGLLVGVAMFWMYQGTTETTRTLFLASLALPSVLSGGINMANSTSAGQQEISKLALENSRLEQKLSQYMKIPTITPVEFDTLESIDLSQSIIPSLLGISTAYASENIQLAESGGFNPSVQFTQPEITKRFLLVLDVTKDRAEVKAKLKRYEALLIPDLTVKKSNDTYYIIQQGGMSRTQALFAAEELKRMHEELSPKLLPLK